MIVWRLDRAVHNPLEGEGARRAGGRWNPKGIPLVYASTHLSLAVLEKLVHVDPDLLPDDLVAVEIDVPDSIVTQECAAHSLPSDWRSTPVSASTQAIGAAWAEDRTKPGVLFVPSVIIPRERNILLNPAHPDAGKWRVVRSEPFAFDRRLLGGRSAQ